MNYSIPASEVTPWGTYLINYIINTIGEENFNSLWEDETFLREIVLQASRELLNTK